MNINITEEDGKCFIISDILRDENIDNTLRLIPRLGKTFGNTDCWICLSDILDDKSIMLAVILYDDGDLYFEGLRTKFGELSRVFSILLERKEDGKYLIPILPLIAVNHYNEMKKLILINKLKK